MRDPERIGPLLNRLAAAWKLCPDLRLGQLIVNAAAGDPFYLEDETLITRIESLLRTSRRAKLETSLHDSEVSYMEPKP